MDIDQHQKSLEQYLHEAALMLIVIGGG